MKTVTAWHFSSKGVLLDGREIKVGAWQKLRINDWRAGAKRAKGRYEETKAIKAIEKRRPVLCCVGFHASRQARHALQYTFNRSVDKPTAELVEIRGYVKEDSNKLKLVGTERRVIAMLGVNQTRRAILLFTCANVRKALENSDDSHEQTLARELKQVEKAEAYLWGEGPKPKKYKRETFTTSLIRTIVDGAKFMDAIDCANIYPHESKKGTFGKILLKMMGV